MKHGSEKLKRLKKYTRVYRKLIRIDDEWVEAKQRPFLAIYLQDIGAVRRKPVKKSFASIGEAVHFALYGSEIIEPLSNSKSIKFKEAWELWKIKARSKVEEQTWARYVSYRRHFDFFSEMEMENVTPDVIDRWFALMRSEDYLATQRSIRVDYRHEFNVLKQVFRHYQERVNRNFGWPFLKEHSQMLDLGRRRKRPEKDLKPREVSQFLECLKAICTESGQEIIYWVLSMQYALCLRVQEAAALSFEDFDLDANQVTVGRRVVWARSRGFKARIAQGTKANDGKTIPLARLGREAFQTWILKTGIRDGFLFLVDGEPMSYRQIEYRCTQALKRARLPFRATHVLRHASLTEYYTQSGGDLKATQAMAGHGSVKSTDRYVKARKEQMVKHIDRLDEAQAIIKI